MEPFEKLTDRLNDALEQIESSFDTKMLQFSPFTVGLLEDSYRLSARRRPIS